MDGKKISPFNIDFLSKYKGKDVNKIINLLYYYKYDIINALFVLDGHQELVNILNTIKNALTTLKPVYTKQIRKIKRYYIDNVAYTFNLLDTNTKNNIKTFI